MNIYLYNEGLFWRAYEYSSHAFVNNLTGSINIHLGERIVNETVEMIIGVFKANVSVANDSRRPNDSEAKYRPQDKCHPPAK